MFCVSICSCISVSEIIRCVFLVLGGWGVRANLISTLILFVPDKLNQNQLNLEFEKSDK